MCPDNINELTIGDSLTDSWEITSHFINDYPKVSGAIVVMSGDVVNAIFCITIIIVGKRLPRDSCDGLQSITTGLD